MTTTSESLLQRLGNGEDSHAWNRFVAIYAPLVFYWARRAGLQPADASDVVQDVMILVSQKIKQFEYDRERSFRGWLRQVTVNQFRLKWRRKKRWEQSTTDSQLAELPDRESLESTWDSHYRLDLVRHAIASMRLDFAPKTWGALNELLRGDAIPADVARRHEISIWTLYSAKSRLLKRLTAELDGLIE